MASRGSHKIQLGHRSCGWCRRELPATSSHAATFCSKLCRQTAWRLRRRHAVAVSSSTPAVFVYADPPYPGLSRKYYRDESTFAGEVDHGELLAQLVSRLEERRIAGFGLSTGAYALRELLPLLPPAPATRVCAWVKPIGVSGKTYGLHNAWEPLIVVGGRQRRPGRRDWLRAMPARGGGTLPGRKPLAFCSFLFSALGMQLGDTIEEPFPGTGVVSRAWAEACRGGRRRDVDERHVADRGERHVVDCVAPAGASRRASTTSPGAGEAVRS